MEIDQAVIDSDLKQLKYYLDLSPERTFSVDTVNLPEDTTFQQPIHKGQNTTITPETFVPGIKNLIKVSQAHAIRIHIWGRESKTRPVFTKIIRLKDDEPVIAFGEKPNYNNYPERIGAPLYPEPLLTAIREEIRGLGEIANIQKADTEAVIERVKKELAEQAAREKMERDLVEAKARVIELEDEVDELENALEGTEQKMSSLKQLALLAGMTFVKGDNADKIFDLAGLLFENEGGFGRSSSALSSEKKQEPEEQQEPEETTENSERRTAEAEIYKWMKTLDEKAFQRFSHLLSGITHNPRLMDEFLRRILEDQTGIKKEEGGQQ
jgi:hypothetical protein